MDKKTADDLKAQLKERKRPRGLRSKILGDIAGIESEKEQGTFKASETGAKEKAKYRNRTKGLTADREF